MAAIDDFLKCGRLDAIVTGISKDDTRALLGEPESVSVQKHPQIWKYGSLELTFYNLPREASPFLISISLYFHTPDESPPKVLALSGWTPSGATTFEEFRAHLLESGIKESGGVAVGPHQHLVLGSAVRVTFDEGRLYSIGHTAKREPEFKQLTVNVRTKDLDMIRQWAQGRHVSMTELCSEWIKEQVARLQSMAPSSS